MTLCMSLSHCLITYRADPNSSGLDGLHVKDTFLHIDMERPCTCSKNTNKPCVVIGGTAIGSGIWNGEVNG